MRNRNTQSMVGYVLDNLYWAVILFFLYRKLLFLPVFGLSYRWSQVLLALTVAAGIAAGILVTRKYRRNSLSVLCNLAGGYGVYFCVSFWRHLPIALWVTAGIAAVLVLGYVILVLSNFRRDRKQFCFPDALRKLLTGCFLGCRTLVCLSLAVLIGITAFKPLLGLPFVSPKVSVSDTSSQQEQTISNNMETVLLLQQEQWERLDLPGRVQVMQVIADIEANYLGIGEVTVCSGVLGEKTRGVYENNTRTVTLNLDLLGAGAARDVLKTLCHEVYHAYQHELVILYNSLSQEERQLFLFREAGKYKEEFESYIDGETDYEHYIEQWCEIDSNAYAYDAVEDYYNKIQAYLQEQS